jgi:hypothetical protein
VGHRLTWGWLRGLLLGLDEELVSLHDFTIQISLILEESVNVNCCLVKEHTGDLTSKLSSKSQFDLRIYAITNELLLFINVLNVVIRGLVVLWKLDLINHMLRSCLHHGWELIGERRSGHVLRHLLRRIREAWLGHSVGLCLLELLVWLGHLLMVLYVSASVHTTSLASASSSTSLVSTSVLHVVGIHILTSHEAWLCELTLSLGIVYVHIIDTSKINL